MVTATCDLLHTRDVESVVDLLASVFSATEPPAVAVGLTHAEMERLLRLICPASVSDGLTVVARARGSDRIVGVMLTDDLAAPPAIDLRHISDKFGPIFAMLQGLEEQYRTGRSILPREHLHLFMLGVAPEFAGRGIAQQLVAACLENGRQKGFTHAVTEATGTVSQRVFRKLGFADGFIARYQDYRFEGRAVFGSIKDHDAAILMHRAI